MAAETLQQAMERLARMVAGTNIVGRVPEPLVDPLLRSEGLARWIIAHLDSPPRRSASGIPITRRTP